MNKKEKKCYLCKGEGYVYSKDSHQLRCDVCDGKGFVKVKSPKPEKKATRKGVRIEEIDICDHDDSNPYLQQAPEGTGQRLKAMQQGIDYCLKCRNFYKVNSR